MREENVLGGSRLVQTAYAGMLSRASIIRQSVIASE